jgi:hypothetical protein
METEANQLTWNLGSNLSTIRSGQTITDTAQFSVSAGDVVRINITFSPNANFDFGFVNRNTGWTVFWSNVTSGTFNVAWRVETNTMPAGTYSFFARHNTSSPISLARVSGQYGRDFVQPIPMRITRCLMVPHDTTWIRTHYRNAILPFAEEFGIVFTRDPVFPNGTQMRGHLCSPHNEIAICRISACDFSTCGLAHENHNRGSTRLLSQDRVASQFTIRVVGHNICSNASGTHQGVAGVAAHANPISRDSVVSLLSYSVVLTIQHELGHNLGVVGHCDNNGQHCIMKSSIYHSDFRSSTWCTSCAATIRNNRHRL